MERVMLIVTVAIAAVFTTGVPTKADRQYPAIDVDPATGYSGDLFVSEVRTILDDPRSWHADYAGMRIHLTTPETIFKYCAYTDRSCALANSTALINIDRWLYATPEYLEQTDLSEYRAYVIHHELGHLLGYEHQGCPIPGLSAAVMQPQTLGLLGCRPNGWPKTWAMVQP